MTLPPSLKLPPLQPREACAAALAVLVATGDGGQAKAILDANGINSTCTNGAASFSCSIRMSARRIGQGTAGSKADAYALALQELLSE